MKQGLGIREQGFGGLQLVRKPVVRQEAGLHGVREGSTGRVLTMVPASVRVSVAPRIWAVAAPMTPPLDPTLPREQPRVEDGALGVVGVPSGSPAASMDAGMEVAFYRKYTEAMLRRYMRLSMEAGRVPSLLGREMFRGHVTSYKVKSFEDVVIFCYDVEKCLKVLDGREKELIRRIALQSYSQGEAAAMMGISLRSCVRQYADTLDKLTRVLLETGMLKPLEGCQ